MQFPRHMVTAHFDFALVLAGGGEVVGKLHSQPRSGVLPNALDSRIAICGLIPDLPLITLLRVRRLMPRTFAPLVTDNPNDSRQAVLIAASGVRGVFHGHAVFLLF
jgi:hypothetical protein